MEIFTLQEYYYIKIYSLYKDMQDSLIPHINEEKTLYKFEIEDRIIQRALEITDNISENALSIYRRLPKKIKTSLKYEKDKIFENLAKIEWNDETAYIDKKIAFLHYASILNMGLLKAHKTSIKMGDAYKSSYKLNYDFFPKAYKKLNEAIIYHLAGSQYLSDYMIECIVTLIKYILKELRKEALEHCIEYTDLERHRMIEEYFNAPISINEDCSMTDNDIILLKEHNEWKDERVKHLQSLFPVKYARCPHDEAFFVRNKMMYSDKY